MKRFDELYKEIENEANIRLKNVWIKFKREKKYANIVSIIICLIFDFFSYKFIKSNFSYLTKDIMNFMIPLSYILIIDLLIFLAISGIFSKNEKIYKQRYKYYIIKKLISNFYSNLEYFPQKEMPKKIYNEVEYSEYYNRYHSDDYFEAILKKNYPVQIAEIKTEDESSDSDGTSSTTTIFCGLFAKIILNKSIINKLEIMPNGKLKEDEYTLQMDSSEFEKYFDVRTTSKIKAMQLLTADVMAELIDFTLKTKIKYDITIKQNNLYLRFHCGNMFEPKYMEYDVLDKKSIKRYFYILNFMYNLSNKLIKVINETEF